MKTLFKIFLLLLIPAIGAFLLTYPGVWKFRIENILNKQILEESGWELSIGQLSGHLLRDIESKNVEIINKNGTRIFVPELTTKIDLLNSITGKIYLNTLNIFDFHYTQSALDKDNIFGLPDLEYERFPLEIDSLLFDGQLVAELTDTTHHIDLQIASSINTGNEGLTINVDTLVIKHAEFDYVLKLSHTNAMINNRTVSIENVFGSINNMEVNGELVFVQDTSQKLSGFLNVKNIIIPEEVFEQVPLDVKFSKIDSRVRFETDFSNFSGDLALTNDIGLKMNGEFEVNNQGTFWDIRELELHSDETKLLVTGNYVAHEHISAEFSLQNFNVSKWLTEQPETNISGEADLTAELDNGQLNSLFVKLETEERALFENELVRLNGSFVLEDSILTFSDPFSVIIGGSSVTSEGNFDFKNKYLDINISLLNADEYILNNFWVDSLDNGSFSGDVHLSGNFKQLNADGNIVGSNIKYKDLVLSEVEIEGERIYSEDYYGSVIVNAKRGQWKNIEFEKAEVFSELYKNETYINEINIYNGEEFLFGSAKFDNQSTLLIEKINLLFDNHRLISSDPFEITFGTNSIVIDTFQAALDNGSVEGNLNINDRLDGYLKFSNITSEYLHPLIKNPKYKFSGLMFGQISFVDNDPFQNLNIDLIVRNGGFTKRKFEQMTAKMDYIDQLLSIENLTILENNNSFVNIIGTLPYRDRKVTDKIQLDFNLTETDYNTISQFLPDWFDISGTINGEMAISGFGSDMKTTLSGSIRNGKFERIDVGDGAFRSEFDGENLIFHSFSADRNRDHFTGFGYLPIDLNLHSENFGKFRGSDSLYIFVEGRTSNIDFITKYFEEVDSAPGDYTLALELSGIWDNIIRNGRLSVSDATVYTPLLDDPIEELHGFVQITDNQLEIDNLQGKMYRDTRRLSNKRDNLFIQGGMDMTKFFDPYLNIRTNGANVFFRSLIYELEGFTDFDIAITGRDTILFEGDVAPIDIEMFQSLTTSDLGVLPSEEGSTIIHYKIDFPIKGKFTLTNDQLDMVLIGDISINQFGTKEADFAGELAVEEGEFYYYGDVFTIDDGHLTFDGRGFNPYLDISANTEIDNERIDITVVGELDNPVLTFSSESGFSQSDILELLTWRKRFEDQEISSTQLGYQASDVVLSWFGNQLDKNIIKMSGLDRLGILEDVDVRGTTGLITAEEDFSISAPLTDNVDINYAYRRSFGITDFNYSLGVEVRLNRNLSIVGNIDRSGYMHVKYRLRYSY